MQVLPGAPGTARQGRTRSIIVSTYDGGNATQPRAPGHDRPRAASSGAARHDRPRATPRAPGADVPPATTAGAPGQHRLRAVPPAPDHARSDARHQRAPGHDRPLAALRAARHDRPCATPTAPGVDVPPATTAGAPGQHRLRAAHWAPDHFRSRPAPRAPGHGRPLAASSDVAGHDRPRATLRAPGADVPLATTAGAPGQRRLRAMATATVALPAGQHRLRQEGLPRVPANPRTQTYSPAHPDTAATRKTHSHHLNSHSCLPRRHSRENGNPRPPVARGRLQGGFAPATRRLSHHTTHQVHPAIQVPPYPRSCSTAATGFSRQRHSRAPPPPAHRKPTYPGPVIPPSTWWRGAGGEARPKPALATCRWRRGHGPAALMPRTASPAHGPSRRRGR